jgi:hypothetical protein
MGGEIAGAIRFSEFPGFGRHQSTRLKRSVDESAKAPNRTELSRTRKCSFIGANFCGGQRPANRPCEPQPAIRFGNFLLALQACRHDWVYESTRSGWE